MAQLVERSLPIPEVHGSNPVIGINLYRTFTVNCIEKTKIKKKRPGIAHFLTRNEKGSWTPKNAHPAIISWLCQHHLNILAWGNLVV